MDVDGDRLSAYELRLRANGEHQSTIDREVEWSPKWHVDMHVNENDQIEVFEIALLRSSLSPTDRLGVRVGDGGEPCRVMPRAHEWITLQL